MSAEKIRALAGLMRLNFKSQMRARKTLAETEQQQAVIFQLVAEELGVAVDRVQYDSVAQDWVVTQVEDDHRE